MIVNTNDIETIRSDDSKCPSVDKIPRNSNSSIASTASTASLSSSCFDSVTTTSSRIRFVDQECNEPLTQIIYLENVPRASQMNVSEKRLLWWSKAELGKFKKLAVQVCKAAQRRPAAACGAEESHQSVLGRVYERCSNPSANHDYPMTDDDCESLTEWACNSHMRRGLEVHMNPIIARDRAARKECVRHAVLVLQQNKAINKDTNAESIRRCSERLSQTSRLFARALAIADEGCSHS